MRWFFLTLGLTVLFIVAASFILSGAKDVQSFAFVGTIMAMFWGLPLFGVIGLLVWWLGKDSSRAL
jgi:hypothetical protein